MRSRRPRHPRGSREEVGAASLLVVAVAGALLWLGVGLAVLAGLFLAQRQAQAAADLAALAGAVDRDCSAARAVARANGADEATCVLDGSTARVEVQVRAPAWFLGSRTLTAHARAGPAPGDVPAGVTPRLEGPVP